MQQNSFRGTQTIEQALKAAAKPHQESAVTRPLEEYKSRGRKPRSTSWSQMGKRRMGNLIVQLQG